MKYTSLLIDETVYWMNFFFISEAVPRGADINPELPIGSGDHKTFHEEENDSGESANQEPVIPDPIGADSSQDQEFDDKELKPITPKASQHDEI